MSCNNTCVRPFNPHSNPVSVGATFITILQIRKLKLTNLLKVKQIAEI